ncbi:G-protein coupled receptor GRL101-like [Littorina saxatilis]|uniref:G-protein coupled receptor GRL101-like n=1 Tax=Littorina saxatilis TaxID=31220 RepID=UPI0038B62D5D
MDIEVKAIPGSYGQMMQLCEMNPNLQNPIIERSNLTLQVTVSSRIPRPASVQLTFKAILPPERPRMMLTYDTPMKGMAQTPDWNSAKAYSLKMDSYIHVPVPGNHVIMISFPLFDVPDVISICTYHTVWIIAQIDGSHSKKTKHCDRAPPATIYNTTNLYLRVRSDALTKRTTVCDGPEDCVSGLDELQCSSSYITYDYTVTLQPPAVVHLDGRGSFTTTAITINDTHYDQFPCPDTHFQCPEDGYCLPVYVRCNGVHDCPGREDEADCARFECPGFYRCRGSFVCVHANHLCDGVYHCPQHDDERFCDAGCPQNCTCFGQSFFCEAKFEADKYPEIRFLDAGGSGMNLSDVASNSWLVHLGLKKCGLVHFKSVYLPNLQSLDLSSNNLKSLNVGFLFQLPKLHTLVLAENPLVMPVRSKGFPRKLISLRVLDLSGVVMSVLNVSWFDTFPNMEVVNLSSTSLQQITSEGFRGLSKLRSLDLRDCPLTSFPCDLFQGLVHLRKVWADNFKLCCPAVLPKGFNVLNCEAPSDKISSCDALLRSDIYRVLLSVFAGFALLGNSGSFVYRAFVLRGSTNTGFGVFVTHLCLSDFLMGLYLLTIGIADRVYLGSYLWKDIDWKRSVFCQAAGFLSLLSSEVSAFLVCLITLDRFLVLRFPFSRLHFRRRSAYIACGIAWLLGLLLSAIPLLPSTSHWEFYSQTGICIPLPISNKDFPGYAYSFAVMIIFNMVLFLLIAAGQAFIYWSVTANRMSSSKSTKEMTIARRLISVVVTDFLCWFPIGMLGSLVAYGGVVIPSELNVAIAILVLPLNSALNPFLYTLNVVLERRRRRKEQRLQKRLMLELQTKMSSVESRNKRCRVTTRVGTLESDAQDGRFCGHSM